MRCYFTGTAPFYQYFDIFCLNSKKPFGHRISVSPSDFMKLNKFRLKADWARGRGLPIPPGDRMWMPSPFETDIFLMSANVLDDRRRSANAIKPWTESFRRSRISGPRGGSTGNESDDLQLTDWSSWSVSSVIVGVSWFLFDFSSGVRSIVSGVSGVLGFESSGSKMHILFTAKLSGLMGFWIGTSSVVVFCWVS